MAAWKRHDRKNYEDLEDLRIGLDEVIVHLEGMWAETRDPRLLRDLKLLNGVAQYARSLILRNHPQARMWNEGEHGGDG